MRKAFASLLFAVLFLSLPRAVLAEQRLALVIGNSSYAAAPLLSPKNDADLITLALGSGSRLSLVGRRDGFHQLYFFSACDTGSSNALGGFVQGWGPSLLATGASGFVGGLRRLPDHSSSTFSADSYALFSEHIRRGEVRVASLLSKVRRRILDTGDPTYLAYTFYGDVNLRFHAAR